MNIQEASRRRSERVWMGVVAVASGLVFTVLGFLVAVLVMGAIGFAAQHGLVHTLLGARWQPLAGRLQIGLFIVDSALVTALAMLLALPFGIAVAIFGSLVAGAWERTVLRWILTLASAVPSVAYGWWGLAVVVPGIRGLGLGAGYGLVSAGLVLALMILPTFSVLAWEAILAVPEDWHQTSLALGANDDQNIIRLVLPASMAGLQTAFLTALARAVGETMAVQMVLGGAVSHFYGLFGPGATLTTQILTDMAVLPVGSPNHGVLDFMALVLFLGVTLMTGTMGRQVRGRGRP